MPLDPVLHRELRIYLENQPKLFGLKKDVLRLLLAKKGVRSEKMWLNWVLQGAMMYAKEAGEALSSLFPREMLSLIAKEVASQEEKKLLRGDYDGIKLAHSEDFVNKKAAVINEALSHLTLAKVAEVTALLESTTKKGSEQARKDLHVIVKKVASLVESQSLDSLEVQASLFDLVEKAESVYEHFSGSKVAGEMPAQLKEFQFGKDKDDDKDDEKAEKKASGTKVAQDEKQDAQETQEETEKTARAYSYFRP